VSRRIAGRAAVEVIAIVFVLVLFGIPFLFVILNAGMDVSQAARMELALPEAPQYLENFRTVLTVSNNMLIRAFYNSTLITVFSILGLIAVASMAGFVLERRKGRGMSFITFLVMAGLMVPPAVVPTIKLLQTIGLYKTLIGLIFIEIALQFPFSAMLYRAYMVSIPRELDEASFMEGCSGWVYYTRIVLPLLRPVTATVIVLSAVVFFNDFVNPLYFLPGADNVTIQLTLYNFMTRYSTEWNNLLANVLLISIPPLAAFIIFNKRIVSGMVAGAIKA
jgi:raffinose/stachyose/melibiose transport system permease protein